ncbi:MAG: Na+/H+ antiporter NhaA [Pirellulaceae bacterium]|nr:MAG: Na+/H+ antiporter NhaA [Pirellulaceae bacterium]
MAHLRNSGRPVIDFLFENSCFLLAGTILALVWANIDEASYRRVIEWDIGHAVAAAVGRSDAEAVHSGQVHSEPNAHATEAGHASKAPQHDTEHGSQAGHHGITLHFIINDVLMALFFAMAAKEVWESLLPGGALSNFRKAATPLLATAGGVVGPALVYTAGAFLTGTLHSLGRGWAIPCATDIAFSYLFARMIFGAGHPAIAFLLLLAIADDAAGLIILAVFYPTDQVIPAWFLLTAAAVGIAFLFRWWRVTSFWWYLLIPGTLSWFSFYMANIHAALGLVPIIPCMPHAHTDLGIFAREELGRHDTLNEFEHWWKRPVELILGLFGLANAGVVLSSIATGTFLVLFGLLIGKPAGITFLTWVAEKWLRLEKPTGMTYRHVVSLGMVAAIGFTVALFVSTAAFPQPGPLQDAVKMGALLSFVAAPISIALARALGIRPSQRQRAGGGKALAADGEAVVGEDDWADQEDATGLQHDGHGSACLAGS